MATTWNPADEANGGGVLTLSNGNKTVTYTSSGAGDAGLRSTPFMSAGLLYAELNFTTVGFRVCGGVSNPSGAMNTFKSGDSLHEAYVPQGGNIQINNGLSPVTIAGISSGTTICIAVDFTNNKIWFRNGSGNWNGSGTANPDTNTGGFDISGIVSGGLALLWESDVTGDVATLNAAGPFTFTKPSTFIAWDSTPPPSFSHGTVIH